MAKRAAQVRFGVVTAWPDEDWHSKRLVDACARRGAAATVDPAAPAAFVTEAAIEFRLGNRPVTSFDALLLARAEFVFHPFGVRIIYDRRRLEPEHAFVKGPGAGHVGYCVTTKREFNDFEHGGC